MNRIDRLIALIILLQSKKLIKGKEIANYFNISLRTVYRDINAICEAGVPVAAEAGEGYSIVPGYHLPPVMFTKDEAAALFTGAKFAEHFTDQSVKKHCLSAITKIQSVLPDNTKDYLEKLQKSIFINTPPAEQNHFRDDVLATIQEAMVDNLVLKIDYYAAWSDSWSEREIEPLGIAYYNNHWHLIAWCRLRNDVRDFRADRLKKVCKTNEKFTLRKNSTVKEYINNLKQNGGLNKVCIKVPRFISFSLKEKLILDFDEKADTGEYVQITFMSPGFSWLIPLLLSYSTFIEILYPLELKKILADQALKTYTHHSK